MLRAYEHCFNVYEKRLNVLLLIVKYSYSMGWQSQAQILQPMNIQ